MQIRKISYSSGREQSNSPPIWIWNPPINYMINTSWSKAVFLIGWRDANSLPKVRLFELLGVLLPLPKCTAALDWCSNPIAGIFICKLSAPAVRVAFGVICGIVEDLGSLKKVTQHDLQLINQTSSLTKYLFRAGQCIGICQCTLQPCEEIKSIITRMLMYQSKPSFCILRMKSFSMCPCWVVSSFKRVLWSLPSLPLLVKGCKSEKWESQRWLRYPCRQWSRWAILLPSPSTTLKLPSLWSLASSKATTSFFLYFFRPLTSWPFPLPTLQLYLILFFLFVLNLLHTPSIFWTSEVFLLAFVLLFCTSNFVPPSSFTCCLVIRRLLWTFLVKSFPYLLFLFRYSLPAKWCGAWYYGVFLGGLPLLFWSICQSSHEFPICFPFLDFFFFAITGKKKCTYSN